MLFTSSKGENKLYRKPSITNIVMTSRNTYKPLLSSFKSPSISNNIPKPIISQNIQSRNSILKEEYKPNIHDPGKPKPMRWGEPTWYLFHTLAEKVKEESFPIIKDELLDLCYTICINLPCSICANHAKEYMNSINYHSVKTKSDFILLFFNFHNTVNTRKNYQMFPFELLHEKYGTANTINIIKNFIYHFQEKYNVVKLMSDQMYRKSLSEKIKIWFNTNINHFQV
jgi:hypothetical protein